MTENIQKGFTSELIEIFRLLAIIAARKLNLQHILYLAALITFGIGDGVTGAYMMSMRGAGIEANPIASYLFTVYGFDGFVAAKVWFTSVLLIESYMIQLKSPADMYWTVNGFLIALTAGGLMAVNANLSAIAGKITAAPGEIILAYLSLVLVLTEAGSIIDEHKVTAA